MRLTRSQLRQIRTIEAIRPRRKTMTTSGPDSSAAVLCWPSVRGSSVAAAVPLPVPLSPVLDFSVPVGASISGDSTSLPPSKSVPVFAESLPFPSVLGYPFVLFSSLPVSPLSPPPSVPLLPSPQSQLITKLLIKSIYPCHIIL